MSVIHIAVNESGLRIGESHPSAKLTNGEVDLLLEMHAMGQGYRKLAVKFEISKSQVRNIVLGRKRAQTVATWRVIKTGD